MGIDIKELKRIISLHHRNITKLNNKIEPLFQKIKSTRYTHESIEYNLKKIVQILNKWKHQIQRNENKLIDSLKGCSPINLKINLVQLKELHEEHQLLLDNQYTYIRFLLE